MFSLNKHLEISVEDDLYIIDNFYQEPNKIVNFFNKQKSYLHKENQKGFNGTLFEDRRFSAWIDDIIPVYNFLSELIKQSPLHTAVCTNKWRGIKNSFNDYKNNYWWPHIDRGYTGIVYLNRDDTSNGTNLYNVLEDNTKGVCEHKHPWQNKNNYNIIKTITPIFNRMVLFDGLCYHGMNICNDRYFDLEYRLNQVFFFKK